MMLQAFLRQNWMRFFGSLYPGGVQIAIVTSCLDEYGNDLALIFVDRDSDPTYVMKIARSAEYGFKLEREFATLQNVGEDEHLQRITPAALHLGVFAGRTFFIEEGIRGTSLSRLMRERGLSRKNRKLLEEAADYLVAVNSRADPVGPLTEATDGCNLGLSSLEGERLAARFATLSREASRYYLHGDYWPKNLLVRDDRIVGILDWEFAVPASPLPSDLIWFLVNIGYILDGTMSSEVSFEDSYRRTFFQPGESAEFLDHLRRRYFRAMGIDDRLFLPLLEVSLSQMAQREQQAYGHHGKMDGACLEMLHYTLTHEHSLCVG